jgi:hypothetical protein
MSRTSPSEEAQDWAVQRVQLTAQLKKLDPMNALEVARLIYSHLGEEGFACMDSTSTHALQLHTLPQLAPNLARPCHLEKTFSFSLRDFPSPLLESLSDLVSKVSSP